MGLAASQARLLLLTARKSDLEYRAQCITNTEMILAMQTEAIARKYSNAISNTALFFTSATDATLKNTALSTGNFIDTVTDGFRLQRRDTATSEWVDLLGDGDKIANYIARCDIYKSTDGTYTSIKPSDDAVPEYTADSVVPISVYASNPSLQNLVYEEYTNYDDKYNPLELVNMLNAGTLQIVDADGNPVSLSGNNEFSECYYTDDDAQAEAEYKRETAAIQVKEKRLQNDLHQVETQQKACEQEIDSVKKIMDKNIEKTFKVFS